MDEEYIINVTERCNWDCPYCIVKTHTSPKRSFESVIKDISDLPYGCDVTLSGGEPGLLTEEQMDTVFLLLKENDSIPVDICSNGLFLEKHSKHLDKVKTVYYHCVTSLNDDIKMYDFENTEYLIVVTKEELHLLDGFLDRYPDIRFNMKPAEKYGELSKRQMLELYKHYRHRMTQDGVDDFFSRVFNMVGY